MATDDSQPTTAGPLGSGPPLGSRAMGHDHDHDNCDEALAELYTYIDGELTVERRTLIAGHLDDCNPCFEAFDFEAELRIVIAHRCRESVPDALRQRIADQLDSIQGMTSSPPAGSGGDA